METEKIIAVTGRGNIHVVPDVTRVEVKINSILRSYDTAYQMAEANLKDIGEVVTKCGLPKSQPKTTHFSIDKHYHNVYDKGHYTGEQEIHFYSQARNIGCAEEAAICMENSLDITPEDLVGGESVTVTWYLSNGKKE